MLRDPLQHREPCREGKLVRKFCNGIDAVARDHVLCATKLRGKIGGTWAKHRVLKVQA